MKYIYITLITILISTSFISCERSLDSGDNEIEDLGIASFSYRHQFDEDVPGTLDMISDMGINNMEFSSLFGLSAAELRELLDERGIVCTSLGVGYNDLLENPEQVISDAHTLGAKYVRVATIPHDRSEPFTIEHARKAVEDFSRFGQILSESNLHFLYHNHGYEFRPYEGGTLFDYIVQNTDPDYVNFQMDVAWVVHPGHDPVELLEKYPDRFYLTHLKDLSNDIDHDYSGSLPRDSNVPFGTGLVDFEAFLVASKNTNIEYHYIEYEDYDVVDVMPGNVEYVRSIGY